MCKWNFNIDVFLIQSMSSTKKDIFINIYDIKKIFFINTYDFKEKKSFLLISMISKKTNLFY
jgi:hypothetical protein